MKSIKLIVSLRIVILGLIVIMHSLSPAVAVTVNKNGQKISQISKDEALKIGTEAYIFGYPLVTMELTRQVMTNVTTVSAKHAPMGQFSNLQSYPDAADKEVTAPNADTLYSLAWLNLSKEPYIFSIPKAENRYYLMPMLDGWTTVIEDPGSRTTGTKAQKYVIIGPRFKGKLPKGIKQYKSPTNLIWILGRTYCKGTAEDYAKVHAFQAQLSLIPLSANGTSYIAPPGIVDENVDMNTPVREQVSHMGAETYFTLLAKLMKDNPPVAADAPMVAKMAKIGIVPGHDFDSNKLTAKAIDAFETVPKIAQQKIFAHMKEAGIKKNGWTTLSKTGTYGTSYLQRALVAAFGLGANLPQDAVYPTSDVGPDGKPYDGANKYVMHFDKGRMPPVNAFWSLTMYDDKFFFVPNSLNRFNLSSRSQFKYNADGSVDLLIQKDSPSEEMKDNWLPAPEGKFILMLRMYWPKAAVTEGKYSVPPVRKVQ